MDGKTARLFTERLVNAFNKTIGNRKLTYDLINMGADEFVSKVECIKETQSITTVADQAGYDLEPDYLGLYLRDEEKRGGEFYIKYYDTSNYYFITYKAYQKVIYDNDTTSVSIPSYFTIHEKTSLPSQVTGTTTSDGTLSGGTSTLTDSSGSFSTAINARDIVHNSSQDATGVVLSTTSGTALSTAMFDQNGNPVRWNKGDSYVIQPTTLHQIQLDPPPSTASHTITFYYLAKANPVYHDYGTWQIQDIFHPAFCFWAAHYYLNFYELDEESSGKNVMVGASYLAKFNEMVQRARHSKDKMLGKSGFSVRGKI